MNLVVGLSMLDKSRKIPTSLIWLPLYMANFSNQLENVKGKPTDDRVRRIKNPLVHLECSIEFSMAGDIQ